MIRFRVVTVRWEGLAGLAVIEADLWWFKVVTVTGAGDWEKSAVPVGYRFRVVMAAPLFGR